MDKKRAKKLKKMKAEHRKKLTPDKLFELMRRDLTNFKILHTQKVIDIEKSFRELNRDSVQFSTFSSAFVCLLADILNMPQAIIGKRFFEYCNEKSIIRNNGLINGEVDVKRYNFMI